MNTRQSNDPDTPAVWRDRWLREYRQKMLEGVIAPDPRTDAMRREYSRITERRNLMRHWLRAQEARRGYPVNTLRLYVGEWPRPQPKLFLIRGGR